MININIILASKSEIRKQMLEEADIPFEVIVSDADETPDLSKSFGEQLQDISMRKAKIVFEKTINRGKRIIVAADQNMVFDNVMYGKPNSIENARQLLKTMMGKDNIFAYTGNAILYADGNKIVKEINNYDISRLSMDKLSDEVMERYLKDSKPLTKCGGISISDAEFLHLKEGRLSTAYGMTIEYLQEMIKDVQLMNEK